MSTQEKELRNDFESCLRGEEPPPVTLARAAVIDRWEPIVGRDILRARCMTVAGDLTGDEAFPDGMRFETGAVVWIDRDMRWARTIDGLYRLGDRAIPCQSEGAD